MFNKIIKNNKQRIPKQKVYDDFKEKYGDSLIPDMDTYIAFSKKMRFICKIHGEFFSIARSVYKRGCPTCGHIRGGLKQRITPDEHERRIKNKFGDAIIIDKVTCNTTTDKCRFICKKHGEFYGILWDIEFASPCGCPICSFEQMAVNKIKPIDFLINQLLILYGDNIKLDEITYIGTHTKCKFICKKHGEFWAFPFNIIRGVGCPFCSKESMETPVLEALNKKGINPLYNTALEGSNYKGSTKPLYVDFIIETDKGKLAIETDGITHFLPKHGEEELKYQQEKDRHKDKILKERGYILIRVTSSPTKEWGFKNHITLKELLHLIEIGIDSETKEIDFDLFWKYDFNRESEE